MNETGPNYDATVDALERHGRQLIETAADALAVPVPSCPGWKVRTLVAHLGHIYDWAARNLAAPPDARVRMGRPQESGGVEKCAEALTELIAFLRTRDPHTLCAGPLQPRTAAWWARRQLLETVIHRWDVENAVGEPAVIDADVAAVGVAEFLEVFATAASVLGPVTLRATDRRDGWSLRPAVPSTAPMDEAVIVTAPSADLLLLLWGRRSLAALEVEGRAATYDSWRDSIAT